ncbi:fatty acyl-CoA reductase [Trypanosoma conorhini]|uniref:Fatty acyl-CoA reductase n=1 Tax=Trypanosoma conorhini TaxID=83891 RepID=A0A3R7K8R7_9TRYP|nr:fatty acyl-CoA reductase [Trypanosoma conorhini]RNF03562.1 fatty acyl-CoA reductase [Trypanosoma conorhini]
MSLDVYQAFSRKSFFVTGGSGFMGKVLLFKLLKEFPDLEAIYVLIRGKTSRKLKRYVGPQERLEKEVLGSPCFDPLRESLGAEGFKLLSSRVVGVEGNINEDRLGLSDKDCQMILKSVHYIVHMAATVNFDERLNVAVDTNTLGGLRALAIAKECRKLEAMVHVSTCYVNHNRQGSTVEECLYPLPFDPEAMCKSILSLNEQEVDEVSARLLKKYGFPNTYTFTKSMGEQLVYARRGKCPVSIVRPSIVGCSYKEPVPGWVDALTAAGGLLLTVGLGVVHEVSSRGDAISDIVPVDFVVNTIIKVLFKTQYHYRGQRAKAANAEQPQRRDVSGTLLNALAKTELSKKNVTAVVEGVAPLTVVTTQTQQQQLQQQQQQRSQPQTEQDVTVSTSVVGLMPCETPGVSLPFVYHAATSSSTNHLTWKRLRDATRAYWNRKSKHPKALSFMTGALIESDLEFMLRFFLFREVPYQLLRLVAHLPHPVGSREKQRLVEKLGRALYRSRELNRQFRAFTMHEWVFATRQTQSLDDDLNERSRSAFYFDTYMINWWFYAQVYAHGLLKYIVKDTAGFEPPEQPAAPTEIFRRASSL